MLLPFTRGFKLPTFLEVEPSHEASGDGAIWIAPNQSSPRSVYFPSFEAKKLW